MRLYTLTALATLVAALAPGSLLGQGRQVSATGGQDLNFGSLLPGVPTAISHLDALNSGQFDFRGAKDAEVRVDITLPAALIGPAGRTVPLQFGPADGGFSQSPNISATTAFDLTVPLVCTLSKSGRLYLFMGGTALPSPTQQQGSYSATITVSIAYTGN